MINIDPGGVYAFKGAVNREGRPVAMQTHLIGPSVREVARLQAHDLRIASSQH